jgi:hypothetical protein
MKPHSRKPRFGVELHHNEIAKRIGISLSTFRRRVAAGVYQLDPVTRQAARIRIDGFPPAMQQILSIP